MSADRIRAAEGELIPPDQPLRRRSAQGALTDENLDRLAAVLDDIFQIPGTNIRFGIDAIIGLIPGLGDMVSSLASFVIIFAAWQRGLPKVTIARMFANVALDSVAGAVPFLGDVADVVWKANRKNYQLLQRDAALGHRRQTWRDWLFLALILAAVLALAALPWIALFFIVRALWR